MPSVPKAALAVIENGPVNDIAAVIFVLRVGTSTTSWPCHLSLFPLATYNCPVKEFAVSVIEIVFRNVDVSWQSKGLATAIPAFSRIRRVLFALSLTVVIAPPLIVNALCEAVRCRIVKSCMERLVELEIVFSFPARDTLRNARLAYVAATAAVVAYVDRLFNVASWLVFHMSPPAALEVKVLAVLPESFKTICVY